MTEFVRSLRCFEGVLVCGSQQYLTFGDSRGLKVTTERSRMYFRKSCTSGNGTRLASSCRPATCSLDSMTPSIPYVVAYLIIVHL